jgi:hypothetical protein
MVADSTRKRTTGHQFTQVNRLSSSAFPGMPAASWSHSAGPTASASPNNRTLSGSPARCAVARHSALLRSWPAGDRHSLPSGCLPSAGHQSADYHSRHDRRHGLAGPGAHRAFWIDVLHGGIAAARNRDPHRDRANRAGVIEMVVNQGLTMAGIGVTGGVTVWLLMRRPVMTLVGPRSFNWSLLLLWLREAARARAVIVPGAMQE